MCDKKTNFNFLVTTKTTYKNPESLRNANLLMKSVVLVTAIICSLGIGWVAARRALRVRCQFNVITLKQTLLLVTLLYLDSIIFSYGLLHRTDHQLSFMMEMFRIILVENIFFKFLVPLLIILHSRRQLKTLWAEREAGKLEFFLTPPSLIARPVISKYPVCQQTVLSTVKPSQVKIIATIHNTSDQPDSLPPVD